MNAIDLVTSSDVFCIERNKTVSDAARLMSEKRVGCLIVVEERGKFSPADELGIITERDVLKKVVAKDLRANEIRVSEVMSKPVITVEADAPAHEVSRIMEENNIRRVAVVDKNTVVGVVTLRDVNRMHRVASARMLVRQKHDEGYDPRV